MWVLTLALALLTFSHGSVASAAEGREGLRLELHFPDESIPLGEPFRLRTVLLNESGFEVRVAPVFFLSHDHLELEIFDPDGKRVRPPSGAIDTCSRVDRDWFTLLGTGEFVGADFEISPELSKSINYIYGLKEGCYEFQVRLHLHDFSSCFTRVLEPASVKGTVESGSEEVCFTAPLDERVNRFREQLDAESMEEVLEALIYFSNVRDPAAGAKIRALLSPPEGWSSRFPDPYHALTALSRQHDDKNAAYFHEALGGRYGDLAAEALEELVSAESP